MGTIRTIMVGFPPIESNKGIPLVSQNRQFQWFNSPTYIYPVIPATAATMLKEKGYDVIFKDAVAERMTVMQWLDFIDAKKPDLVFFEAKTPVIRYYWDVIDSLKNRHKNIITVLAGDHVTALPNESMERSLVDYVITGGDFDFLLANLVDHVVNGTALEPGIYYREKGAVASTGHFDLSHDLNRAPVIDRDLTNWKQYAYDNGNYKHLPGTYIMAGRDCWHHACTFCSWTTLFPNFRVRAVDHVVDEIAMLSARYHIREVMDDTGCFPVGSWLHNFCDALIKRRLNRRVAIDCNMRFGALTYDEYRHMRKAGFRFILFGLESANQATLDRVGKRLSVNDILVSCRNAKRAGLSPHITVMFGYPWEGEEDVARTIALSRELMIKGYAHTMQATIVIPYPGTPLFDECSRADILSTRDWERYDMREPIMVGKMDTPSIKRAVQELYSLSFHPRFLLHKLLSLRDADDIAYYYRAFRKVFFGHLKDFS